MGARAHKDSILKRESTLARDYELHLDTIEKKKTERVQKIHTLQIKKRRVPKPMESKGDSEDEFIPDDYYSDSEYKLLDENNAVSSQVKNLLAKVNGPKETVELVNNCPSRIYFTSRTHSQLNQFAHQLKLTSFESSFMNLSERTKFLPMASRKQLCINPKVNKLKDLTSINDACMDMQKSSTSNSVCRCEFFPKLHNLESEAVVKEFIDTTFTSIHDIEDLVAIGEDLKICPYYSVRSGVPLTEIIALPYQMLLQNSSRESLKLKIDDAIIIIDEAHNLFDVISSIYSVSISEIELELIIGSLKVYLKKFAKRLNSGNRINLMKLIKLCQVLKGFMEKEKHVIPGKEILVDEIFNGTTGDSVNVHKLEIFYPKVKLHTR